MMHLLTSHSVFDQGYVEALELGMWHRLEHIYENHLELLGLGCPILTVMGDLHYRS